jgi:hypothetical protein
MLVLLTRRIYELRRSEWVRCLDIRTNFHKDWLGIQKLVRGGNTHRCTNLFKKVRRLKFINYKICDILFF